jgi:hypothetical protein
MISSALMHGSLLRHCCPTSPSKKARPAVPCVR